ncbi:MAG: adenylate/guanylate cyclase domain-containing protein [Spirochaetota bacterium]
MDLRLYDFQKNPSVRLDGEWEFYWREWCYAKRQAPAQLCKTKPGFIQVPGAWNSYKYRGKPIGGRGYATYKLSILVKDVPKFVSIKLPSISSAYTLWINGKKIGGVGNPGRSLQQESIAYNTEIYPLQDFVRKEEAQSNHTITLILQVSNFRHRIGGIQHSILLGEHIKVFQRFLTNEIIDYFLFGAILIMGLYHLGLYSLRQKDTSTLWFGIFCLLIVIRIVLTGERYLEKVFPGSSSFFLFIEYINLLSLPVVFASFLQILYPKDFARVYLRWIQAIYLLFCTLVLAMPSFYYTQLIYLIQSYILLCGLYATVVLSKAFKNRRTGAKLFLFGWCCLFLTIINDIFYHQLIIHTTNLVSFGLFIFIFSQAWVLSMLFASTFRKVEELTENLELKVLQRTEELKKEKNKSDSLLLNILPEEIVSELKEKGSTKPVLYDSVSVIFTDFKGFTNIAEKLSPRELVKELDACFGQFDKIIERSNLEKLKTIGDSYMCAGGIPKANKTHAVDCVLAALEIQNFMNTMKQLKQQQGLEYWEIRLGIHSGPLVAGVIGEKKFAYDVWGDTVNTASRMESSGTPGKINISGFTYGIVKELFACEYRGKVNAKNKGEVDMYYVKQIKAEYSLEGGGRTPNNSFWRLYKILQT